MKRSLLSLLTLLPACSAAPPDLPSEFGDTPATQTEALTLPAVPASFWATLETTPGYIAFPNGDQIDKRCVQIVKPGQAAPPMPHKRDANGKPLPCPYPPIKGKKISVTRPVEPNTLVAAPAETFSAAPSTYVTAEFTEYHTEPNLGWKSQYNITGFWSQLIVPPKPTSVTFAKVLLSSQAQKWDGSYPYMSNLRESAGAFLQYGSGQGGVWTMFTYAQDRWGYYRMGGPWYDLEPGRVMTMEGRAKHITVPYWGAVTEWRVTVNSEIPTTWWYPEPFDMNFFMSPLEWVPKDTSVVRRKEFWPLSASGTIQYQSHFFTQPHGCTPNDEDYPLPAWMCNDSAGNAGQDTTPKWKAVHPSPYACSGTVPPCGRWNAEEYLSPDRYDYNIQYYP